MFNLRTDKVANTTEHPSFVLQNELEIFGITKDNNYYNVRIGDEDRRADDYDACAECILDGVKELKQHIWDLWHNLKNIADIIHIAHGNNNPSFNNILFLNSVKMSYFLSKRFNQLKHISTAIKQILDIDIEQIDKSIINQFVRKYLEIKCVHCLIIDELYRLQLLNRIGSLLKIAQIAGPWSNIDLPMKERVWEWSEDEEYFANRTKARKEQVRYNPENNKSGFYFVWQEVKNHPYSFEDRDEESPYPNNLQLSIP